MAVNTVIPESPRLSTADENANTNANTSLSGFDNEKRLNQNEQSIGNENPAAGHKNSLEFDGPEDPSNPLNWSKTKKWSMIGILSVMTFVTPLASAMFAPSIKQVLSDFNTSSEFLGSFLISVYNFGYASGPLVIAPLSELYGQLILYHATNLLFLLFIVASALSNSINTLFVFRVLSGMAGSAVLNLGGGTIASMFVQEERGRAMAFWTIGPLLGPVVGPMAGGFIAERKGWRWVFWILAIAATIVIIPFFIIFRETYPPVILRRRARHRAKVNPNSTKPIQNPNAPSPRRLFLRTIILPIRLLLFSPIILFLSIFIAIVFGYLQVLNTTFPYVFQDQYGFSESLTGLSYLGLGIGMLVGVAFFGLLSDRLLKRAAAKGNGELKPEYRLQLMLPGVFLIPVSLFSYGWTAQYSVFWFVPIFCTSLFGFSLNTTMMCIQTYIVDAYSLHTSSALAANMILRSILGALLPLAGPPMYDKMGLGWGNTLLGFISVLLIPIPFIFLKYGERLRKGNWKGSRGEAVSD